MVKNYTTSITLAILKSKPIECNTCADDGIVFEVILDSILSVPCPDCKLSEYIVDLASQLQLE